MRTELLDPPCAAIHQVVPLRFINVMGPELLRGCLAGEPMQGPADQGVGHGHDGACPPPAGGQVMRPRRQGGPLGVRRGVSHRREDRPPGVMARPLPARALLASTVLLPRGASGPGREPGQPLGIRFRGAPWRKSCAVGMWAWIVKVRSVPTLRKRCAPCEQLIAILT